MKIGLALGGGGVRGIAHILALETLDECGVTPSIVSGTSMGAIIGALYASGRSGKEIRDLVESHIVLSDEGAREIYQKKRQLARWLKLVRPSLSSSGLLRADGFLRYLMEEVESKTFEELKIPLKVMTTDYHRGEPVVFESGELLPAVQASMSVPGVFVPVEHEGRVLVDGGVMDNLPYMILKPDCDATIAIDVSPTQNGEETEMPKAADAVLGMFDLMLERMTSLRVASDPPTVHVRPVLKGVGMLDFAKIETVYLQSEPTMPELRQKLEDLLQSEAEAIPTATS